MNLLSRTEAPEPFPTLDPEQCARFESRLSALALAVVDAGFFRRFERSLGAFEGLMDELESEPSLITALDLLGGLERARVEASTGTGGRDLRDEASARRSSSPPHGELICYWPGRSLSTGEAGVASRGFFDVGDRPPIALWIEAVARPADSTHEKFEIAIIAWIPKNDVDRATAGRRACISGALAMLDEASKALAGQLRPILVARAPK